MMKVFVSRLVMVSSFLIFCATTFADVPSGGTLPPEVEDKFDGERISFQEAVERSLRQNPQVVIATQEIVRAKAVLEQVRATGLPTLYANGSYTRLDGDRLSPAGVAGGTPTVILGENTIAANVQITAPILSAHSWAAWAHAADNVKVSAAAALEIERQLALSTGRAYLTVLTQRKVVEVSRIARDAARAHHDFARARQVGGIGNRIDEVRAAQELASSESQLQSVKTQLARAREALGVLVGVESAVDATEDPDLTSRGTAQDMLDGIGTRTDVKEATLRKDAAHKVTRDSFADYIPLLTAVFQPFYQDPPSLTVPRTGWQGQLVLQIPLFDGGARYGARRERSALEREAQIQLQATLRQARSEVRVSFEAVQHADLALTSADSAAQLAKEAFALATIAYREGAATNLELIDAERQSRDAATQAALAEDTARQARLDLLVAAGRFPDLR